MMNYPHEDQLMEGLYSGTLTGKLNQTCGHDFTAKPGVLALLRLRTPYIMHGD